MTGRQRSQNLNPDPTEAEALYIPLCNIPRYYIISSVFFKHSSKREKRERVLPYI
jgi:hypothetical protein